MKSFSASRMSPRIAALVIAVLATACATVPPPPPKTPEEIVTERANERWKAAIVGDVEKSYSFTAPSYRAVVPLERYRGRFGTAVMRESAETVNVTCEATRCEAVIRINFVVPTARRMGTQQTHVRETWVLEEGQWWLHQRI